MLLVVLDSLLFLRYWLLLFLRFQATFPCYPHSALVSQTRAGLHQLWTLSWLLSIALLFRHIFTASTRRFLPYGPSLYSCHNLLLSRLLWKPAVLPWHLQGFMLILETGPGHLLICFTAIHNLDIPNNTYLNRTNYYHELLVVKNLVICSLLVSNSFRLFKVICKDYKNTLNRTCTGNNRFDETAHQRYFEKGATRKAAKHHRKQSIFN